MNYQNIFTPVQHLVQPPVNTGGLCWLVFAKWQDVLLWPQVDPKTGLCSSPIGLKPGCTWYKCELVDKGRSFNETMKVGPSGPYWDISVDGYQGGNTTAHTLSIAAMQFHRYVVMFKERDGQIRFIGNQDTGADLTGQYTSGDIDASRKRTLSFGWQHVLPAPIYVGSLAGINDDVIVPPFEGEGDFNDDFGDDFSN